MHMPKKSIEIPMSSLRADIGQLADVAINLLEIQGRESLKTDAVALARVERLARVAVTRAVRVEQGARTVRQILERPDSSHSSSSSSSDDGGDPQ